MNGFKHCKLRAPPSFHAIQPDSLLALVESYPCSLPSSQSILSIFLPCFPNPPWNVSSALLSFLTPLFFSFHSNYPRSILCSSNHLCSFSSILLPSLVSSLPPCVSSLFFRSFVPSFISSSFCPFSLLLSPRKVKHITACGLEV